MSFPPKVRKKAYERDFGMCTRCLTQPATNVHHRRPGKMGGSKRPGQNSLANALSLCGMGNTSGCHGWIETHRDQARELGYLLRENQEPSEVPLFWRGKWVRLTENGTVEPVEEGTGTVEPWSQ